MGLGAPPSTRTLPARSPRVTEVIKVESFGVPSETDVQSPMKAKLGIDGLP